LHWQIIDTPGLLDRSLDERNSIEMKSIAALVNLKACVIFILDISETCGYTLKQQATLFDSIKPLLSNRPIIIACNKIDLIRSEEISVDSRILIEGMVHATISNATNNFLSDDKIKTPKLMYISTISGVGLTEIKQASCDSLLSSRVELKLSSTRIQDLMNRVYVAEPKSLLKEINPAFPRCFDEMKKDRLVGMNLNIEILNQTEKEYIYLDKKDDYKMYNNTIPEVIGTYTVADFVYQV
jgi:nucleolar GTP-binding protein